jgi:hypothetical protein
MASRIAIRLFNAISFMRLRFMNNEDRSGPVPAPRYVTWNGIRFGES